MVKNAHAAVKAASAFSPTLTAYFTQRGHEAAMRLPEDIPAVSYMTHEIDSLTADYSFLNEETIQEALYLWSQGFEKGIRDRVESTQWNARDALRGLFQPEPWTDADRAVAEDNAAANHRRINGTIHLPKRGVK